MPKRLTRKIYVVGEVSDENYLKFSKRLSALERQSKAPIEIELMSFGGEVYSALAWAARIQASPCEVNIKAYGIVASAAVLILAAGDNRKMSKSGWVMVHEDSTEVSGDVTTIEMSAKHGRRIEKQWSLLLAQCTTTSASTWERLHKRDLYMDADECIRLGLIDGTF